MASSPESAEYSLAVETSGQSEAQRDRGNHVHPLSGALVLSARIACALDLSRHGSFTHPKLRAGLACLGAPVEVDPQGRALLSKG